MSVSSIPRKRASGSMPYAKKMELMSNGMACMGASGRWGAGERGASWMVLCRLSDLESFLNRGPMVMMQEEVGLGPAIPNAPIWWLPTKAAGRGGDDWFMSATKGLLLGATAENCGSQGFVEDGAPIFSISISPKSVSVDMEQADAWAAKAAKGVEAWLDSLGFEHVTLKFPAGAQPFEVMDHFAQIRGVGVSWAIRAATPVAESSKPKVAKLSL